MADDEFNPSQATTKAKNQTVAWIVVLLMIAISLIAFGCSQLILASLINANGRCV